MKTALIVLIASFGALAQSTKVSLQATIISGITSAWSGEGSGCSGTVDNRSSASRRNWYHSIVAAGTGSWSVTIRYSNVSCAGPWTSYSSQAAINQASSPAVAFALDVYSSPALFVNILVTGNAVVTYTGQNQLPLSTAVGAVVFPIQVSQGGTGSTSYPLAGLIGQELQYFRRKPNAGSAPAYEFATQIQINALDYDWPAQTPGGSLIAGGIGQAVTLSPCPLGIVTTGSGATALYLSHGTGGAEWLRPIGGTCTPGATGTVLITPANNHTGAWTVSSATAGIDLACASSPSLGVSAASGAYVVIPPGDYNIYGTIVPTKGCTIDALGTPSANGPSGAVTLHMQTNGIPMFDVINRAAAIKNIQLSFGTFPAYTVAGSPATAGSIGIHVEAQEATGNATYLNNLVVNNFYNNLLADNGTIRVQNFSSLAAVQDGIVTGGTPGIGAGYMEAVLSQGSGGNGYTLNRQAAMQWHSINCFNNQGWGIKTNTGAAFQMDDIDCEGDKAGEIYISDSPATVGILQNVILQSAGDSTSWGTGNTAPGLKVAAVTTLGLVISNIQVSSSQGNGMELDGTYLQLSNASVYSNGAGAQVGHTSCFTSAGADQTISGVNCFQGPVTISGSGSSITGNTFIGPIVGTPSVRFGAGSNPTHFCNNVVTNFGNTAIQFDAGATGTGCVNSVLGTVTGTLGYDGRTLQSLPIVPIPNATALSVSSNTIAPTLPMHTLGAGLVKTITAPNVAVSGCFDIIATAAFTTDTSFNIITPAITATVGKLYHACYNAGTTLWSLTN